MKESILVVAPGRGSYNKSTMGILQSRTSPSLQYIHEHRKARGRISPLEIDALPRFQASKHLAGEEASLLTAACSIADFDDINRDRFDIVGICGNSMGHYTALTLSGVLSLDEGIRLIDTMGDYQKGNVMGMQQVYPICDEEWNIVPERISALHTALKTIPDMYLSIDLGYQKIIAGTKEAMEQASTILPQIEQGGGIFPLTLPLHSAFHTPLLEQTALRAQQDLAHLCWNTPKIALLDGYGSIYKPLMSDATQIQSYTLGAQVTDTYQFTMMIQRALSLLAPDRIVLLGPGSNLGGAIAQSIIDIGWYGIHSKQDFLLRQQQDPILLSMGRPEQKALVVS